MADKKMVVAHMSPHKMNATAYKEGVDPPGIRTPSPK